MWYILTQIKWDRCNKPAYSHQQCITKCKNINNATACENNGPSFLLLVSYKNLMREACFVLLKKQFSDIMNTVDTNKNPDCLSESTSYKHSNYKLEHFNDISFRELFAGI